MSDSGADFASAAVRLCAVSVVILFALGCPAVFSQTAESTLSGRWQYLQPPDKEGEVLDLFVASGQWRGIMNGLERAGEHGLFYYIAALENLAVEPDGSLRFEIGERRFFRKRPPLSQLGVVGDSGVARSRMRFSGRLAADDLVIRCEAEDGSCPDSTLRFSRIAETPERNPVPQAMPEGAAKRR